MFLMLGPPPPIEDSHLTPALELQQRQNLINKIYINFLIMYLCVCMYVHEEFLIYKSLTYKLMKEKHTNWKMGKRSEQEKSHKKKCKWDRYLISLRIFEMQKKTHWKIFPPLILIEKNFSHSSSS